MPPSLKGKSIQPRHTTRARLWFKILETGWDELGRDLTGDEITTKVAYSKVATGALKIHAQKSLMARKALPMDR